LHFNRIVPANNNVKYATRESRAEGTLTCIYRVALTCIRQQYSFAEKRL